MLTAVALFAVQAPDTTINIPDPGQIVAVGALHPKQCLGEHAFAALSAEIRDRKVRSGD